MEKTKVVKTGAGDVVVRKLALYDYAEFIRAIKKLPKQSAQLFQSGKDVSNMAVLFEELPVIISESWDDFAGIMASVCDKEIEFFKSPDIDLADALDIVDAALELNDYNRIVNTVKKIMARGQAQTDQTQPKATPAK